MLCAFDFISVLVILVLKQQISEFKKVTFFNSALFQLVKLFCKYF